MSSDPTSFTLALLASSTAEGPDQAVAWASRELGVPVNAETLTADDYRQLLDKARKLGDRLQGLELLCARVRVPNDLKGLVEAGVEKRREQFEDIAEKWGLFRNAGDAQSTGNPKPSFTNLLRLQKAVEWLQETISNLEVRIPGLQGEMDLIKELSLQDRAILAIRNQKFASISLLMKSLGMARSTFYTDAWQPARNAWHRSKNKGRFTKGWKRSDGQVEAIDGEK